MSKALSKTSQFINVELILGQFAVNWTNIRLRALILSVRGFGLVSAPGRGLR